MNDIKVIITQSKAAGTVGFGIPLLLCGMQAEEIPYTVCGSVDDVKELFAEGTAVYKAAQRIFMQDSAPREIAVCGSALAATKAIDAVWDNDWRQLIVASIGSEGEDSLQTIAEHIESKNDRLLFADIQDFTALSAYRTLERTVLFYYPSGEGVPAAALVGASAGRPPGSFTYKNLKLKGLEPLKLSDVQIKAIHNAGALTALKKAGDIVSSEGKSASGEFIDVIDGRDYIIKDLEYREQKLLNSADKIPYDNNGIALLEGVAVTVLQEAYHSGLIAVNDEGLPDFEVSFAKRSETQPGDRAERKYLGGKFRFGLAGAVHTAEIRGEIVI